MLRLVFTAEDLARTTFHGFAEWPETVLSLHLLFGSAGASAPAEPPAPATPPAPSVPPARSVPPAPPLPPALRDWRRDVLRTLRGSPLLEPLRALAGTLSPGQPPPAALPPSLLPAYRRLALDPCRARITAAVRAELRLRASALLHGGYASSLSGLGGSSTWSGSALTTAHPVPAQLRLSGHGLTLQPCYFCPRGTTHLLGTAARPTLLYSLHGADTPAPAPAHAPYADAPPRTCAASGEPLRADWAWDEPRQETGTGSQPPAASGALGEPPGADGRSRAGEPASGRRQTGVAALLGTLFGSTRAQTLLAVGAGCSTTELAQRLKVSLATASQHASALRAKGLLSTHRRGRRVEHLPTALALRLLAACGPTAPPPLREPPTADLPATGTPALP